ncbi:MAG: hypothetical protein EOP86_23420 [Verrucomicrobiaceae bacterium]|nr:MAG: hypothetical protein EOP86_23420 [Verrucomicrobiaceae bacterium]
MSSVRITLLLLLFLRLLGGDGGVLQAVAWAGMLVSRTAESGMATAVQTTFDGEHPCALCTAIQKSEKPAEPKTPAPLPDNLLAKLKLKDVLRSTDLLLPLPGMACGTIAKPVPHGPQSSSTRRDAPPVPPPQQQQSC